MKLEGAINVILGNLCSDIGECFSDCETCKEARETLKTYKKPIKMPVSGVLSKEHNLKIYPKYFEEIVSGDKTFEVRKNDRKFCVGDILILKEWDNIKYSGREVKAKIVYILDDTFIGLMQGYVVIGIKLI